MHPLLPPLPQPCMDLTDVWYTIKRSSILWLTYRPQPDCAPIGWTPLDGGYLLGVHPNGLEVCKSVSDGCISRESIDYGIWRAWGITLLMGMHMESHHIPSALNHFNCNLFKKCYLPGSYIQSVLPLGWPLQSLSLNHMPLQCCRCSPGNMVNAESWPAVYNSSLFKNAHNGKQQGKIRTRCIIVPDSPHFQIFPCLVHESCQCSRRPWPWVE